MIKEIDLVRLQKRLKKRLPGENAQFEMAPPGRIKFKMDYDKVKIGSVLLIFYKKNNEIYIPLMLRPNYDGVHSGQVSFPGGKKEEADADLVQTALREAYEEIGIKKENVTILGSLTELEIPASNFKVLPVLAYLHHYEDFIPNQYEVEEIIEAKLEMFLDQENIKTTRIKLFNGVEVDAPYYQVGKFKVWGATAMMLSELVVILKELGY